MKKDGGATLPWGRVELGNIRNRYFQVAISPPPLVSRVIKKMAWLDDG